MQFQGSNTGKHWVGEQTDAMASGGFFRGTSVDQDSRFFNQNKKLLAKLKFPASFDQKVDLSKVKREVINQWIAERVTQLLGFEDDIVVAMVINLLEPKVDEKLDPKQMQLTITGFLEKDAPVFMDELWTLLLSAQEHPTGIPPAILEKKKQEMAKAAQDRHQLRDVLDRKRQDAEASGRRPARHDTSKHEPQPYGLSHPSEQRGRGGRGRNDARGRRERDWSTTSDSRRDDRRRNSSPRSIHRARPRSSSRSLSSSRSPSRSRSRISHGRRRPARSRSRSKSKSRSNSPNRIRYSRTRRSPSSSPDYNRRGRTSRGRRRARSSSSSRSPSLDQFGRRRRRSKSPRKSDRNRGRSSSVSD